MFVIRRQNSAAESSPRSGRLVIAQRFQRWVEGSNAMSAVGTADLSQGWMEEKDSVPRGQGVPCYVFASAV